MSTYTHREGGGGGREREPCLLPLVVFWPLSQQFSLHRRSLLLPHTGDQFVLPTGIHIFLIWGTTSSRTSSLSPPHHQPSVTVHPPSNLALSNQLNQLSVLAALMLHHTHTAKIQRFHPCIPACLSRKHKTCARILLPWKTKPSSCACLIYGIWWVSAGPCGCFPKVFHHAAAKLKGWKTNALRSG